ncbi:hypothetical protein ACQEU3_32560 [Spirillospora sp. CA-253888]
MGIVHEHLDAFPFTDPPHVLRRREELLLGDPLPIRARALREHGPVEAVHFSPEYVDQPRSHPRGFYEADFLRLEVQSMDFRQGFYHRNADVDELSYQVDGERTLITELGTLEHVPGDFSRLPAGVSHDNHGRRDKHMLFYTPGPVRERVPAVRLSEYLEVPFPGWEPAVQNEMITEMLGGKNQGIHIAPIDETLLLETAEHNEGRLRLVRPTGTGWLYEAPRVLIGVTSEASGDGRVYTCHRDADEIQYQVSGTRTLVTQRGALEVVPGDFVRIPMGVAFTSVHAGPSEHIMIAAAGTVPQVAETTKRGRRITAEEVEALR